MYDSDAVAISGMWDHNVANNSGPAARGYHGVVGWASCALLMARIGASPLAHGCCFFPLWKFDFFVAFRNFD